MSKYIKTRGLSSRVRSMLKYNRFTKNRSFWILKAQEQEGGDTPVEAGWVGTAGLRTFDQIFNFSETFVY